MASPIDPEKIPAEIWRQMNISKERFAEIQQAMAERELRTPAVGSLAPDFDLELLSPSGERTGKRVRLSHSRGRPVALVFGSYT
jgi:hypothetical protein